jgi:hypothetical protein
VNKPTYPAPMRSMDTSAFFVSRLSRPRATQGQELPAVRAGRVHVQGDATLSRVLGKRIECEQVSFEAFTEFRKGGTPKPGAPRQPGHQPTISSWRRSGQPAACSVPPKK